MDTDFYREQLDPRTILPSRYHPRKPVPIPAAQLEEAATAGARQAHTFHAETWKWFSESLRRIVGAVPSIVAPVQQLIEATNPKFGVTDCSQEPAEVTLPSAQRARARTL